MVSGHSGGGQFANRYAASSIFESQMMPTNRNLHVHYVSMNPSSYVYFDGLRFDPLTLDLDAGIVDFVNPTSPPSTYNEYGYGLEDLYGYIGDVGSNTVVAHYPGRKVLYLVGDADTGTASLDVSASAMLQGTNRYERGLIYYEHLKTRFPVPNLSRHRLAVIPGVGHNSFDMITSSQGLRYHFQGHLRITNVTVSGSSATIDWSGGDGLGDVEISTNLLDWVPVATNVPSPHVDTLSPTSQYIRIKEPFGP